MKKGKISLILVSLFALTNLASCKGNENNSSKTDTEITISINKKEITLLLGEKETLQASFSSEDLEDKSVQWSSSDATVATVSDNGEVSALAVGSAVITAKKTVNGKELSATCTVTVVDNVLLSAVDSKHEFVVFEENKEKDPSRDDGFIDHNQTYKVGDDNNFNVKPELTVLNSSTLLPVGPEAWHYDFDISAKVDGQNAGSEYFSVVDARNCDVKFTQEAVGKTFTISVAPGGVDAARATSLTKNITVEVVDGYNVYNAKEISYFDTRVKDDEVDDITMEGDERWKCQWYDFKTANGLDPTYRPASLIFQKDIKVTTADIPSNFVYTAAKAAELGDTKAAGTLLDWVTIYEYTETGSITLDGNYFSFDLSAIPLVVRDRFKTTAVGAVVSHANFFRSINGENVVFKNLNMSGNAKNATKDEEKIYGGGFIFMKGAGSATVQAHNIIATKFFITFMGNESWSDKDTVFSLNKVKCFNNYNSFLYNWGSTMVCNDSLFRSCGGPIVIQDHINTNDYEAANGLVTLGLTSTTNFNDCTLDNYVAGGEAWFQQFNATAVVPDIKGMSDLFYATGLPKSFVVDENKQGKVFQMISGNSYFNFVAFNKSGKSEGMTNFPCYGNVNITNSGKASSFDYRKPVTDDPVALAYATYSVDPSDANQQALLMAAAAKGVTWKPDYSDAMDNIKAYLTPILAEHVMLRELNNGGAPVFDFGSGYPLLGYDGANGYLQELPTIVAEMTAGGSPSMFVASDAQKANMPDYVAVYYKGMMLVFSLTPYVA